MAAKLSKRLGALNAFWDGECWCIRNNFTGDVASALYAANEGQLYGDNGDVDLTREQRNWALDWVNEPAPVTRNIR